MANAHVRNRPAIESLGILTGAGGVDYVTAATVDAHTYVAITALDASTVTATSVDTDIWDSFDGTGSFASSIEVPAGCTIYGKWSSVTIGTGDKAMVYRESSSD